MLLFIVATLQFGLALGQIGLFKCPLPWVDFEDKCIKFELVAATLPDAIESCNNDGASLLSINSRKEHEFVDNWLQTNSPVSLKWYTSGYKEVSAANNERDVKVLFYWEGDGTEVQGAQYWLTADDRNAEGDRIIYSFSGAIWGWVLVDDGDTVPRSYICEINKTETYKILASERGFDYGQPVLDPNLIERGPKFDLNPVDIIYEAGDKNPVKFVEFRCEADGSPYPEYAWYRTRQQTSEELDPLEETKLTITNGRLVIHNPADSVDNGDYHCKAENRFGSVMSRAGTLTFGYLNDFSDTAQKAVEVDEHKGISIDCKPPKHGYDSLSYSWYKDESTKFIFSDRKPHIFNSRDGKLYFSTATNDDQGEYTCQVAVPGGAIRGGKHSMPIRLIVRESSGNVYEPEMVNGFPKVYPSSTLRGDDVYIECVAWGSSPLDYYWTRVGGIIPAHAELQDNNRVLHIPKVQIENGGEYVCTVTRRNGQSTSSGVPLDVRAMPYFPIPLRDQHVDKGGDLTWRCYGKGIPEVDYRWYRDAEVLNIDDMVPANAARFNIENNVLTIREVKRQDEGMYQCQISNSLGTAFSAAQLRTVEFEPTFDKYPLPPNQYATKGGRTTIICNPESAPPSEKFWFKDSRNVNPGLDDTSRVQQLPNGNLHISRVQESDGGIYTCKAVNALGESESSGNLTILSSTTISYNPTNNQRVRANSTAFLHCDATFNPTLDLTYDWWHNNYHIEFERLKVGSGNVAYFELDPHYRRGEGIDKGGLFIRDVQQWHAGDYFCVTKTSSDERRAESSVEVVGPPSPPAGVTADNLGSHSADLTWWPGAINGASTQYYVVEGFNLLEGVWRRLKTNIRGTSTVSKQVMDTVEGLSPGSQYRFRVRAVNEYGEGDASDQSEQIYTTEEAPPTTAPQGLNGGGGKVGELQMWWEALPKAEHNGEGIRYKVFWKETSVSDEDKWESEILTEAAAHRFVTLVGPDRFYTEFNIKIQAINNAGEGPVSESVTIFSAEGMPVAVPKNVRAVYFNATAITVHFISVPDTRDAMQGVLGGYRVNYWKTNSEEENMAQFRIIEGQTNHGLIIGLSPNTYYTVNVQVYNSAGLASVSEDYITRTLRNPPLEAPQEVQVYLNNDHEIELEWRGVSTTIEEEPLEGYAVRIYRRGENIYVATDYDAGKKTRKVIDNLETNIMYELRVYGYSRGGVGLQSSPTLEFILGKSCIVREDSPDKEYIYKCGACFLRSSGILIVSVVIAFYHLLHGIS